VCCRSGVVPLARSWAAGGGRSPMLGLRVTERCLGLPVSGIGDYGFLAMPQ
jgi:hypothetical protein